MMMVVCNKQKLWPHPDGSSTKDKKKKKKKSPMVCLSKSGVNNNTAAHQSVGVGLVGFGLPIDLVAGEGVNNKNVSSYICIWFRLLVYDAVPVKVQSWSREDST